MSSQEKSPEIKIETSIPKTEKISKTLTEKSEAVTHHYSSLIQTKIEENSIRPSIQDITSKYQSKNFETTLNAAKSLVTSVKQTQNDQTKSLIFSMVQTDQKVTHVSQLLSHSTATKVEMSSEKSEKHTFHLHSSSINDVPNALVKEQKTSAGRNVGIIVGVLLMIVIVILIILYIFFRRRANVESNNETTNYDMEETNTYDMDQTAIDSEMSFLTSINEAGGLMTDAFFTSGYQDHESEENIDFFNDPNYEEVVVNTLTN